MSAGRYENNDRLAIRKLFDMVKSGLVHCGHTRTIVFLAESFEVNLNGDWPDSWPEVEESVLVGAEPFCNISAVGHGS